MACSIDVGAHIGYFSLHLGKLVGPDGHVYCFEPDARARTSLIASLQVNQMPWVTIFPQALAAKHKTIDFMLSPQLGWSTAVQASHLTDLQQATVEGMPLDLLVEQGRVPANIQFIKIDVEGFEAEVIRGMRHILENSRPIVLLEANRLMLCAQGESVHTLIALLADYGYEAYAVRKFVRGGAAVNTWLRRLIKDEKELLIEPFKSVCRRWRLKVI